MAIHQAAFFCVYVMDCMYSLTYLYYKDGAFCLFKTLVIRIINTKT
jgi:hypothetical protein